MTSLKAYDPEELVFRGVESDELDYKAAMNWNTMSRVAKGKLLRHLTAFANTRGGFLVIGVAENDSGIPDRWTGVSEREAASFDPTAVGNFISSHVEPPLDFTIDRPEVRGRRFVIFAVRPFSGLPHICCRGIETELQEGVFYIRTGEASSRPARRALEMQNLIRRCMRNEREQLGRVLRGILYETGTLPADTASGRMPDLAEDAEQYFRRRHPEIADAVLCKFFIIPQTAEPHTTREERRAAVAAAPFVRNNAVFLNGEECLAGGKAPGSLRMLSRKRPLMWQFFDGGLFLYFRFAPEAEFTPEYLARFCAEAVAFAGNLAAELCGGEELLTLKAAFSGAGNGRKLQLYSGERKFPADNGEIAAEISRSAADLVSGRENHALRLFHRLGENFKLPDRLLDPLEPAMRNFLARR